MNEIVRQWLEKADGDLEDARTFRSITNLRRHTLMPFLCQQCVEKMLKGAIIAHGVTPPFTHDLVDLSDRLSSVEPTWTANDEDLAWLGRGAVRYRYPTVTLEGGEVSEEDAERAFGLATNLRARLLPLLEGPAT